MQLFGFAHARSSTRSFERLIAVNGIGPKVALAVLSGIEPADLVRAIRQSDVARLTRIPGVGKKTAERIVIELRDRLPKSRRDRAVDAADAAATFATMCCRRWRISDTSAPPPRRPSTRVLRKTRRDRRLTAPARRAEGAVAMTADPRLVNASRRRDDDDAQVRSGTAAAHARRLHRPGARARESPRVDRGRPPARRGARSRAALRPARARQDDARLRHRQRDGRARAVDVRPVLEKPGDLAAILTNLQAREVLFIDEVHRMSPVDRGDSLSGDGGLRARHRHRPGPGRAIGQGAAAAVHAHRRDDARGAAHGAAARALRHRPSPGFLRARADLDDDRRAIRADSRRRDRAGGRR